MTFGIDIATPQRDLDINRAKAEGVEFVIVKMGGLNVTPQYVAPYYKAEIDRVVAAGLPKGHYYLIGGGQVWQSPTVQARHFAANLYRFDPERDILMVDNEGLDSNGYLFDDAEAAEFLTELMRLKPIPAHRVWHYAGANDYRNLGPWPKTAALGVRFVWAAYGDYPTGHTPDHEPSLQGSIPRWDVHQFSSKVAVAGYALDGNYSRETVADLFGGGTVPLNNYTLRSPSTVILADDRDPYVSWQHHLERTNYLRGGVDIVASVGTPVYARTSGIMIHVPNDGSAGNSSRFHHDANPGWKDVFSHLSGYVGVTGQHFNAGDVIAYTGNSGNVTQHLHWHLLDPSNTRRNPWDYFSGSGTAGGGYEEIDMPLDANDKSWLNEFGKSIIEQITGVGAYGGAERQTITTLRRDLGYIHETSPWSLKAIRTAQAAGGVDIAALVAQLAPVVVQGVLAGLPDGESHSPDEIAEAVVQAFGDNLSNG